MMRTRKGIPAYRTLQLVQTKLMKHRLANIAIPE